MKKVRIGETEFAGSVRNINGSYEITLDGKLVHLEPVDAGLYRTLHNGRQVTVAVAKLKDRIQVDIDSYLIEVFDASNAARSADDHHGAKDKVTAPMPGKVVKVLVAVGDQVSLRQQLVLVEAMKMENPVAAPAAGVVKGIHVAVGDQVDTEKVLVELEITPTTG